MPLGTLTSSAKYWNVGHSCKRFGLRIFKMAARTWPCKEVITINTPLLNVWADNPSIPM